MRGMLAELAANHGATVFVATLKARNFRSLALLESLGFERSGSDEDEIIMRRRADCAPAR